MLLYDIFDSAGAAFDACIPLRAPDTATEYARCVNGEPHMLYADCIEAGSAKLRWCRAGELSPSGQRRHGFLGERND